MHATRSFGSWLRQLRLERDFTQDALAEIVGCAGQTLRSFEIGRRRPSREMAERLADVLAMPADERAAFVRAARLPLAAPATPADPAPAPRATIPSSLPAIADALIGRQAEIAAVRAAFLADGQRLVTLLGPGGAGKTRLAHHLAVLLAPDMAGGAAIASLEPVRNVAGLIATVAAAVNLPLSGITDAQTALVGFLAEREMLVVLDNLEHLLGAESGDEVAALLLLLLAAPRLRLLVTSRERLNLQTEWVVEVGGLALPADDRPETSASADAVLFFMLRARRISRSFTPDAANQRIVAQICRKLDGLPLAIELAAAQIAALSPAALLARLDQALPVLVGGARDLPQRQRTIRATIQWSYDLLPADERAVFERLGVLIGSWGLDAAEAIAAGGAVGADAVFPLLRRLLDRSLVMREPAAADGVRYRLLEPVRQFAVAQLGADPPLHLAVQRRHAQFFASLAEHWGSALTLRPGESAMIQTLRAIDDIYPNVRLAIGWALSQPEPVLVARIGWALCVFWWYSDYDKEPGAWMGAVLGTTSALDGRDRAQALAARALVRFRVDPACSLTESQEAAALFAAAGDTSSQAFALLVHGLACLQQGTIDSAIAVFARAQALSAPGNYPWLFLATIGYSGLAFTYIGNLREAESRLTHYLALARSQHVYWHEMSGIYWLMMLALAQNRPYDAAHLGQQAIRAVRNLPIINPTGLAFILEVIALVAVDTEPVQAAFLLGATEAIWQLDVTMQHVPNQDDHSQRMNDLRHTLAAPAFAADRTTGRTLTIHQALDAALAIDFPDTPARPHQP